MINEGILKEGTNHKTKVTYDSFIQNSFTHSLKYSLIYFIINH